MQVMMESDVLIEGVVTQYLAYWPTSMKQPSCINEGALTLVIAGILGARKSFTPYSL